MVGVAGFEPATPTSRTWCATRLRYTPITTHGDGPGASGGGLIARRSCLSNSKANARGMILRRVKKGFAKPANISLCAHRPLLPWRTRDSRCGGVGASPSGKAAVFGTAIPRFESWRPSQDFLSHASSLRSRLRRGALAARRPGGLANPAGSGTQAPANRKTRLAPVPASASSER